MSTKDGSIKSYFQKWYSDNKNDLNEKRRKKYKTDAEYRQAVKDRQAQYRRDNPPPSRAGRSSLRAVGGHQVEVFRMGQVSQMVGKSEDIIRYWEAKGVIPKPTIASKHRYYTKYQVMLMKELFDLIDVARSDNPGLVSEVVEAKGNELSSKWNIIGD